jgi:fermentation-respiration switch protein FrsA (DUF1100 family)
MMTTARELFFCSGGVRCAADLYWPDDPSGDVRCVVMGHGGTGTKRLGLPKNAEKFTAAELAVLAFDYRYFGRSGGQPRQLIDVPEQHDDYRAAIDYVRGVAGIDVQRIGL